MDHNFKTEDKFTINWEFALTSGCNLSSLSDSTVYTVFGVDETCVTFKGDNGIWAVLGKKFIVYVPRAVVVKPMPKILALLRQISIYDLEHLTDSDLTGTEASLSELITLVGARKAKLLEVKVKEEYESTVAKLRSQPGRIKFVEGKYNFGLSVLLWKEKVEITDWKRAVGAAAFGVYFKSSADAEAAIRIVGEKELVSAMIYETEIGL